ncbi:rab11 family-interacting protein 3 isoform X2 [Dunckerocampus dactyliophorus]|uniref:rab11 family-interacting protein 3 isoform X2 n=1 Tax=Dunckerocampus dactyliophorus TaxID=161453 RepID=UPI00240521C3|nr:rab11 family-interacting protein 3 isoform X2 [Dunckerocampus dactyliophorus]
MEPTVVSSPLGHAQQAFPLGFLTLDSDNGGVLCPNNTGQTGLHFGDQKQTVQPSNMEKTSQPGKPVELDQLLYISDYSCGDLFFDGRRSPDSQVPPHRGETMSRSERNKEPDEASDFMLSWLFSPNLTDVVGKNFAFEEASLGGSDVLSEQTDSSQLKWNCAINPGESLIYLDLPDDPACATSESSGVSHDVNEAPAQKESRETLSCETEDKGLFPDQVTSLPVNSSSTLQELPDGSTPLTCPQGSVPLMDLEYPDPDSGLTLHPAGPQQLDLSEDSHVEHAGLFRTLGQRGEGDSSYVISSPEDAFIHGDLRSLSVESTPKDSIENKIKNEANEAMALDLCLSPDEVSWNLEPKEEVHNDTAPNLGHREGQLQELETSTEETKWTSEQSVDTVSLSKMVGHDSLPVVSAVNTREEEASPLKTVFDALDQDGDGFVRIEEFMEFAAAYGADQVKDLTRFLDPSGLGVISFEDFHRGISAISNGGPEPQLYSANYSPEDGAVGCPEEYDEQNEVTDSAYLGSESTYSECETFTDEDTGALVPPEMHEDVDTDSGIEAALHDPEDAMNSFSLNSELHNPSLVTVISGEEEHFEDFGESNTSELLLESTEEGVANSPLAQTPQQINVSSLLSPSAGKRLSSKKVARHLLQNSSITLDTVSDLTRDILELADNDITDKMLLLERRVAELEKESEASGEQHARLRQENLQLVHRANALEEQLKEQELLADEQLQHETRRHKEALSKMERERGMEVENLQARMQQLDEENSELRSCVPCLRANIERLEEEKQRLEDETDVMSDRWKEEMESRQKMADKLSYERHQNQKEKESTQELIEDLRKQLEHLQLYKLEAEAKRGRTPGAGLQEYQTRTREAELEQEIKRLKQDNRSLKEQNDELNGQIINLSIQGAKNLMSASFSDSLAAEINSVSRSELMEAIHKQEEINYRLQDYIDKIIVAIMESNPSILEVK